jgi:hypothetical protein
VKRNSFAFEIPSDDVLTCPLLIKGCEGPPVSRNSFHCGIIIALPGVMNTHAGRIQSMPEGLTSANVCSSKERTADAVILKLIRRLQLSRNFKKTWKISGIGNRSVLSIKGRSPSFADYARRGTKKE